MPTIAPLLPADIPWLAEIEKKPTHMFFYNTALKQDKVTAFGDIPDIIKEHLKNSVDTSNMGGDGGVYGLGRGA
jgi:hypothetical protein